MVKTTSKKKLSLIPAVHQIADHFKEGEFSNKIITQIVREEVAALKKRLSAFSFTTRAEAENILHESVECRLESLNRPSLKRVINGTGIILHTGLGRAPFSEAAKNDVAHAIEHYCNIEIDLKTGERGDRISHVEELIRMLTGAEAAVVVNNNAAAVLLVLNTLAFQKEVIISRGELVEIGGSFRIPEVMGKSGSIMHEVGTTNKTHLKDYDKAISKNTGLVLSVHTSNYRILGFTKSVSLEELSMIGKRHKIPVAYDLGGGALVDLEKFGLPHEPVVGESIDAGADVVTFSGDKILGGCQAGIIAGKKKYIDAMKKNPLIRALRCDKMTYAVLESTLRQYLKPDQLSLTSPVLKMLTENIEQVSARANRIQIAFQHESQIRISVHPSYAQAGSGTLPLEKIQSVRVTVTSIRLSAKRIAEALRSRPTPVIGFVKDNAFHLDMRTVHPDEVNMIIEQLKKIMNE